MRYRYLHTLSHISPSFTSAKSGGYTMTYRCISLFKNSLVVFIKI